MTTKAEREYLSKVDAVFQACGTCAYFNEIFTSAGKFIGCKKHRHYPINYFRCNMSIVCDNWESGEPRGIKNESNFRRLDNGKP